MLNPFDSEIDLFPDLEGANIIEETFGDLDEPVLHGNATRKRARPEAEGSSSSQVNENGGSDINKSKFKKSSKKTNRRKNIRKVKDDNLGAATEEAMKYERERLQRLQERNEIIQPTSGNWDRCLNPGRKADEKAIYVLPELARVLKSHQIEGIKFMWDNIVESVGSTKEEKGRGCILSHVMGLGKTLQSVTLVETFIRNRIGRCAMIICPVNTVRNWKYELAGKWLQGVNKLKVFDVSSSKTNRDRYACLHRWQNMGGVLIVGFEMLRNLVQGKRIKDPALREGICSLLLDTAEVAIVDEGHRIKNDKSGIGQVVKRLRTMRRIILTGTPLQNNLMEYYCMVDFVRPNFLGNREAFQNRFVHPIQNGQCVDSTTRDKRLMRGRAFVLHDLLSGFVHRRDYSTLHSELPPKYDFSLFIRLSPLQKQLYRRYTQLHCGDGKASLFKAFHSLGKICSHPCVLALQNRCDDDQDYEWWRGMLPESTVDINHGGKFVVCFLLLQRILERGDKTVIFSQSLTTLDLLEKFMGAYFKFHKGKDYFRIDGSISAESRQKDINEFNRPESCTAARVFLVSTKAGALGINLVGGNHVIIMDTSWNPANDLQATFRCYRFGQTKPVYIYRLVSADTLEQRIYERQITKLGMALRIVDEHEIENLWKDDDLYNFHDSEDEDGVEKNPGLQEKGPSEILYRTAIILDSDDDEDGNLKEVQEPIKEKNKRGKNLNRRKLYGEAIEIPCRSPLVWLCAHYGQSEQQKIAMRILEEIKEAKQQQSLVPSVPLPLGNNAQGTFRDEFRTPSNDLHESRLCGTEKSCQFSSTSFPWTEKIAWIKGMHQSKDLLQHQENNALTEDEQKKAKKAYENCLERDAQLKEQLQHSRQVHMSQTSTENVRLEQVKNWNVSHVLQFLDMHKLSYLKTEFARQNITGESILHLLAEDLVQMRVPPKDRENLLKAINKELIIDGSPVLASTWQAHGNEGDVFFYNRRTRQSFWHRPEEMLKELEAAGLSRRQVQERRNQQKKAQTDIDSKMMEQMRRFARQSQRVNPFEASGSCLNSAIDLT